MSEATGTFECSICGRDTPHNHHESETIRFHQHRPVFEKAVFKRIKRTDTTYHFYAIGGVEIKNAYHLGHPANDARGKMDWAELSHSGDGYAQEWLQTLWEFYKEGMKEVAHSQAPDTADEDAALIDKLGKLLAGVAIALKGPEPARTRWSYHNLPEIAARAMIELEIYRQQAPDTVRNAARYRWLRSGASNNRMPHITQYPVQPHDSQKFQQIRDVGLDAAIDSAIAQEQAS